MAKFVIGVLSGVTLVVAGILAHRIYEKNRPAATTAPATGGGAVAPPLATPPTPVPGRTPAPAASRPAAEAGVAAAQLLARAKAIKNEAERVAAFQALVDHFPESAEALSAREALAEAYRAAGDAYRLRNALSGMLWRGLPEAREAEIKREIITLNESLIFSRRPSPDGPMYDIKPGDAMQKIARPRKVTPEFLARLNGLRSISLIRYGDSLKVVEGPFDCLVELGKFRLTVLLKGQYVKEYRIGIGKDESTPIGKFTVTEKLVNPTWTGPEGQVVAADDPQNPLGERWIGISGRRGYGIHGTIEPETVGTAASRGCIRLVEKDVEEVYDFLVPQHSTVTIVK